MAQAEVRQMLGPQAKTLRYALKPAEETWRWQFMAGQDKKVFEVLFDGERRVLSSTIADDERQAMPGGK